MRRRGRPYPKDPDRRKRVRIELAKRDMSVADLARTLGLHLGNLYDIIIGKRISPKTEAKIAAYFDLPAEALFPRRKWKDVRGEAV
jgi:transcriptional regulator with XRE-family HTH domain